MTAAPRDTTADELARAIAAVDALEREAEQLAGAFRAAAIAGDDARQRELLARKRELPIDRNIAQRKRLHLERQALEAERDALRGQMLDAQKATRDALDRLRALEQEHRQLLRASQAAEQRYHRTRTRLAHVEQEEQRLLAEAELDPLPAA